MKGTMRYGWFLLVAGLVFGLFVLIAPKAGTQNLPALETRYRPQLVVQAGHKGKIFSTAFSPDGKLLASAGDDNTIKLWDVQTGNEFRTLYGHTNSVRSI